MFMPFFLSKSQGPYLLPAMTFLSPSAMIAEGGRNGPRFGAGRTLQQG